MRSRQPRAFNIPSIVLVLAGSLIAVHVVRTYLIDHQQDFEAILLFSFIPARYASGAVAAGLPGGYEFPGGMAADIWTFLTYGALHANWTHLLVNMAWMVAFGSAVAQRFGAGRFLALTCAATVGGALLHLATRWGDLSPVIGASAAVSGYMGAAVRFALAGPDPMIGGGRGNDRVHAPAAPLFDAIRDRRVIVFLAVWFGINLLFGTGIVSFGTGEAGIAWEAHIGGFLVGLLGFGLFDPPRRTAAPTVWH
jgi:membrane associated rhomboid family serine protease